MRARIKKNFFNTFAFISVVTLILLRILLLPNGTHLDSFFLLVPLWIAVVYYLKLKSNVSFFLSITLFVIWVIIIPLGFKTLQSMLNVWSYTLFALGVLQLLYEEINEEKR